MFIKHRFVSPFPCLLPILMLVLALAGCAKVQPEPFAKFSASVQELRSGTDNAASLIGTWSEVRTVEELASLEPKAALEKTGQMKLMPPPQAGPGTFDPATVTSETEPLFFKIERFRRGLYEFNSALVEYGKAMQALASPDLVSAEAFDAMRTELNGNLKKAAKAFGVEQVSLGSGSFKVDGFALFSTISIETMRNTFEQRRKDMLIDLIHKQQQTMEAVSKLGLEGINILWSNLRNEYNRMYSLVEYEAAGYTSRRIISSSVNKKTRKEAAERLVAMNKAYSNEIRVLDALHIAYDKLPKAHAELAVNLQKPGSPLDAISDIYNEAKRLYTAYEALRKQNEGSSK